MNKLLYLLLILIIVGILWIGSRFWEFSSATYVNDTYEQKTINYVGKIDLELLKKEFQPANEY